MGQFSNSFPKHFSYLCEYAIRFDLSCSFCEYPFIFHCLHCSPPCFDPDSLLLAYLWLGLSWIDCISANKSFSSSKTSSRKPYTSSKQQERHKHSVEITINFSARPLGGLPGPTTHWLLMWGGAGVGTRHQPHSARSCELALRAVGAAQGRPGGAPPAWVWGVRGRALSHPRLPALWAGCRGPLRTGCGCGGLRAWGPVTNPTARALARCGGGMRVTGGGASCLGVGRPGSGALPPPTARPLGGLPGPTTHWLWVWGGAGVGTRHQPHSARFCELALRAVLVARGRPGGAPPAWMWGVRVRVRSDLTSSSRTAS